MIVNIPEHLISARDRVREIRVTFEAFPGRELQAEIKEIGMEASALTRTFPVTLIMDQPEDVRILPGMTGQARARVDATGMEGRTGIELPLTAVASADGATSFVWVIDEETMTVSRREVTIGSMTPVGILVLGIEPGEWVATAGVHYLQEGQEVRSLLEAEGRSPS